MNIQDQEAALESGHNSRNTPDYRMQARTSEDDREAKFTGIVDRGDNLVDLIVSPM
jgi:hypothetical protein